MPRPQATANQVPAIETPDDSNLFKLDLGFLENDGEVLTKDPEFINGITRYFGEAADMNVEAKELITKRTNKKVPLTPEKTTAQTNLVLEELSVYRKLDFDAEKDSTLIEKPVPSPWKQQPKKPIPSHARAAAGGDASTPKFNAAIMKRKDPNLIEKSRTKGENADERRNDILQEKQERLRREREDKEKKNREKRLKMEEDNRRKLKDAKVKEFEAKQRKEAKQILPTPMMKKENDENAQPKNFKSSIDIYQGSVDIHAGKSFVPSTDTNYNVDDLSSNDETDDESKPRKTVPNWAEKDQLYTSAKKMMKNRSTENRIALFGAIQQPNLKLVFDIKIDRRRNSSAIWNSPLHQPTAGASRFPKRNSSI